MLVHGKFYTAKVTNGFYFGRIITGQYDSYFDKIFVMEGINEGFSIGVNYLQILL